MSGDDGSVVDRSAGPPKPTENVEDGLPVSLRTCPHRRGASRHQRAHWLSADTPLGGAGEPGVPSFAPALINANIRRNRQTHPGAANRQATGGVRWNIGQ